MSKRKALLCAISTLSVTLLVAVAYAQRTAPATIAVTADVIRANRIAFPEVRLQLGNLRYTGAQRLPNQPANITARPVYARDRVNRVIFANAITQRNLVAFYLIPGDRITATVRTPVGRDGAYRVTNITRVATRQIAPIAQPEVQRMRIATDRATYTATLPVRMELVVTNTTSAPVTYNFSSGQQYDFWVTRDGREVWRWSAGMFFTQALTSFTLQPGESRTFAENWNQQDNQGRRVPPGQYVVNAQLTTTGVRPAAVTRTISVVGRNTPATSISDVRDNPERYVGQTVTLSGIYYGWRPPQELAGCADGPPVTRSDWALSDGKACLWVTGPSELDPQDDYRRNVTVRGQVALTEAGRLYLHAEQITTTN